MPVAATRIQRFRGPVGNISAQELQALKYHGVGYQVGTLGFYKWELDTQSSQNNGLNILTRINFLWIRTIRLYRMVQECREWKMAQTSFHVGPVGRI